MRRLSLYTAAVIDSAANLALFLAAVMVLYWHARDAIDDMTSQHEAVVDDAVNDTVQTLEAYRISIAARLEESIGNTSEADVRLIHTQLHQSFDVVRERVSFLDGIFREVVRGSSDAAGVRTAMEGVALQAVRSTWEHQHRRCSGLGITITRDDTPAVSKHMYFVFWADNMGRMPLNKTTDGFLWYRSAGESADGSILNFDQINGVTGETRHDVLGFETPANVPWHQYTLDQHGNFPEVGKRMWNEPLAWSVGTDHGVTIHLSMSLTLFSRLSVGGGLPVGQPYVVMAELDIGHWAPIVQQLKRERQFAGFFFLSVLDALSCILHSNYTEPPTTRQRATCHATPRAQIQVTPDCFPGTWQYGYDTYHASLRAREVDDQKLWSGDFGSGCEAVRDTATADDVHDGFDRAAWLNTCRRYSELEPASSNYYLRKAPLDNPSQHTIHIVWFVHRHSVAGNVDQLQSAVLSDVESVRSKSSESKVTVQDEAHGSLQVSLYLALILFGAALAFLALSFLGRRDLLITPLHNLTTCIVLMGTLRVDEAIKAFNERPVRQLCAELREINDLSVGFLDSAERLQQYCRFLPQCCLVDTEGADNAGYGSKVSWEKTASGSPCSGVREINVTPSLHLPTGDPPAQQRRVSLLCANRLDFLPAATSAEPTLLREWFSAEVGNFLTVIQYGRGIVDLISGDHFFASFNASRHCATHRTAAVLASLELSSSCCPVPRSNTPLSIAVCTGNSLCASHGNTCLQSFMIMGSNASVLRYMDRLASHYRASVLIDAGTRADTEDLTSQRLCTRARYKSGKPFTIWEVTGERERRPASQTEWMYEMDARGPDLWSEYNSAVALWILEGKPAECAAECGRLQGETDDERLQAELGKVVKSLHDNPIPPLHHFGEAEPNEASGVYSFSTSVGMSEV